MEIKKLVRKSGSNCENDKINITFCYINLCSVIVSQFSSGLEIFVAGEL